MTPDPTLLDLADEMEALAERLRELFHLAADRELAEMERHSVGYMEMHGYDEPDPEAMREAYLYRGRAHVERMEDMGVEGW